MVSENDQGLSQRYQTTLLVIFLTFAGLFVRVFGLGEWDYYHDEIWHVYVSLQSTLADVFYANLTEDGHPILGYFLWHWLLNIWNDPWMARLPSIVAGTLCIPAGYFLGKEMFQSRNGGLFAAFFMAFSCIAIEQSNVVRGYMLALFFCMVALWSTYLYQRTYQLIFVLLYFLATSLALLSEFAATPVVAFTALHLLFAIIKNTSNRFALLSIWALIHSIWLLYLLYFTSLLKNIGGVDFAQSHAFFGRYTDTPLMVLSKVVVFFLEYINVAGFFWFLGGAINSELIVVGSLLCLLVFSLVGLVVLCRSKLWDLLSLVVIIIAVTICLYLLNIMPLSFPRRNIALVIVFMVLFYQGLRHCAACLSKYPVLRDITAVKMISICSLALSLGYLLEGENWRSLRFIEFQQTKPQIGDMLDFIGQKVTDDELIITDLSSAYHIWLNNVYPTPKRITANFAIFSENKPRKIIINTSDMRLKAFIMNPHEVQQILREMDMLGMLDGIKNVWFLGIQHINVKSLVIDHTYRSYWELLMPGYLSKKYSQDLHNLIDTQEKLANHLYDVSTDKKIVFSPACDSKEPIRAGKSHACQVSSMMIRIPIKFIYKNFIDAPDYQDPEAFLWKVRKELSAAP